MTYVTSRRQAEEALLQRAHRDPAFRQALLTDPESAISSELGIDIPPDVTITVVEESLRDLYLVIPFDAASSGAGELTDRELATVAGGATLQEKAEQAAQEAEQGQSAWGKITSFAR
jgi:hypothetical protein